MEFHCFGDPQKPAMLLIHGLLNPWQIWEPHTRFFTDDYYVIVPALDAHVAEHPSEFVSLDDEAVQIEQYLADHCGGKAAVVCGLSMGGVIANRLFERGKITMRCLVLDGAPLVRIPRFAEWMMTQSYCTIIHKMKQRDPKTIASFQRDFLPERFLPLFYPFADTMTDESIRNILSAIWRSEIVPRSDHAGIRLLFLHGDAKNEMLSAKAAKLMCRHYPQTVVKSCPNMKHAEFASLHPEEWCHDVGAFLRQSAL